MDEFAAEVRSEFRAVDIRLCKIEARLEQTATKAGLRDGLCEIRAEMHQMSAEMHKQNAEMTTWMLATMMTIIATFLVALFGLHHWNG